MHGYDELMDKYPDTRPNLPWKVTNDDFSFLFYTGGTTGYPKGTVWDYFNRVRGLDSIILTAMGPLIQRLPDLPSEAYSALTTILPVPLTEKFFKGRLFRWLIGRAENSSSSERLLLRVFGSKLNYKLAAGKMKIILVAPLFHGTSYEANLSSLGASAATSIYLTKSQPFDPAELWETVERHKANILIIVGDAFAIPMAEELERKDYDIRSLAVLISSGVRFSPAVKKRFLKKHPGLLVLDELGSTETSAAYSQVSSSDDQDISQLKIKLKPDGVNCSRVINPVTREDAGPGEKGELIFGGFNALGYWKDPEKTAKTFDNFDGKRWFFVGDEGTVDEEGYFNFIGRGSSIINTGGEKVYAEEVEEILMQNEQILDIGVTGVPDDRWGEAVTAIIEPAKESDLHPDEIIEYCRERMAGYKKPKHVFFVERMPRSATGKLERKGLKELAEKMAAEKK
jgi:acyl-CoA synthetase (AMP-forming)/AMP-acid ligase II